MSAEPEENALEEFRELVAEEIERLHGKLTDATDAAREAVSLVEDSDAHDSLSEMVDKLDDVIASAFEHAAERLDL